MSVSESLAKGIDGWFDKVIKNLDETIAYNHGLDLMRNMLETVRMNPVPLSKNNELIDMNATYTSKDTKEHQEKCKSMISFIDTFNGMEIPTKNPYKPDFIEVTNRSKLVDHPGFSTCELDFRFNVLPADYDFEHRPDLMTRNRENKQ
jgi:hypothetical protein